MEWLSREPPSSSSFQWNIDGKLVFFKYDLVIGLRYANENQISHYKFEPYQSVVDKAA